MNNGDSSDKNHNMWVKLDGELMGTIVNGTYFLLIRLAVGVVWVIAKIANWLKWLSYKLFEKDAANDM